MSGDEYRVKGTSLKSKLSFVRERFGEAAETVLQERFRDREMSLILESEWYPFRLFDDLCNAIADLHYGGDRTRLVELGAYSAEKNLRGIYSAYAQGKDFFGFLRRIAILHERFYNLGEMEVEIEGDRSCRIVLKGAPEYSEADTYIAAGFYVGAARVFELRDVRHRIDRRADRVIFDLTWGKA